MAYSWFRAESAAVDHPKVMDLKARLGNDLADAYVFRLWSWTQRFAPSGAISARIVSQLERSLGWDGAPGVLIQTLTDVRLLDAVEGGFEVHDWEDMQGALVDKSNRDAELKKKKRKKGGAKTARAAHAPGERPARLQDVTGRDVTLRDETDEKKLAPDKPAPDPIDSVEPINLNRADTSTKKPRAIPDTEWHQTIAKLSAVYLEVAGAPYDFQGRDAKALKSLLKKARDFAELEARWRLALTKTHRDKFQSPKVWHLYELDIEWPAFPMALGGA